MCRNIFCNACLAQLGESLCAHPHNGCQSASNNGDCLKHFKTHRNNPLPITQRDRGGSNEIPQILTTSRRFVLDRYDLIK